jgi:putative oxidoreductase
MDQFDRMLAKWEPTALSLFRFITGLLMLQYGIAKIFKFPVVPMFANLPPLITAAGTLELVLGALLLIGLFTRIVAFILSGEMAFAYFIGHMFKKPEEPVFLPLLNGGTAAILFCFACLYLATAGGGPYSVDAMRKKRYRRAPFPACHSGARRRREPGMTLSTQPAIFTSSGTAASYLELCSTSEVRTLRTWGAAVRWVTKS